MTVNELRAKLDALVTEHPRLGELKVLDRDGDTVFYAAPIVLVAGVGNDRALYICTVEDLALAEHVAVY